MAYTYPFMEPPHNLNSYGPLFTEEGAEMWRQMTQGGGGGGGFPTTSTTTPAVVMTPAGTTPAPGLFQGLNIPPLVIIGGIGAVILYLMVSKD